MTESSCYLPRVATIVIEVRHPFFHTSSLRWAGGVSKEPHLPQVRTNGDSCWDEAADLGDNCLVNPPQRTIEVRSDKQDSDNNEVSVRFPCLSSADESCTYCFCVKMLTSANENAPLTLSNMFTARPKRML